MMIFLEESLKLLIYTMMKKVTLKLKNTYTNQKKETCLSFQVIYTTEYAL